MQMYGSLLLLRFLTLFWEYAIGMGAFALWKYLRFGLNLDPADVAFAATVLLTAVPILIASALKWRFTRFAAILIVDKRMGAFEAMRMSWRIWKGRFWPLYGLEMLILLAQVAAAFLYGVGLILFVPFTILFWTAAYLDIVGHPTSVDQSEFAASDNRSSEAEPRNNVASDPAQESP